MTSSERTLNTIRDAEARAAAAEATNGNPALSRLKSLFTHPAKPEVINAVYTTALVAAGFNAGHLGAEGRPIAGIVALAAWVASAKLVGYDLETARVLKRRAFTVAVAALIGAGMATAGHAAARSNAESAVAEQQAEAISFELTQPGAVATPVMDANGAMTGVFIQYRLEGGQMSDKVAYRASPASLAKAESLAKAAMTAPRPSRDNNF